MSGPLVSALPRQSDSDELLSLFEPDACFDVRTRDYPAA